LLFDSFGFRNGALRKSRRDSDFKDIKKIDSYICVINQLGVNLSKSQEYESMTAKSCLKT